MIEPVYHPIILTNSGDVHLKNILPDIADQADSIKVVAAFFSDTHFINNWLINSKHVDLLISLRPPTDYYALKSIHSRLGINIQFLGSALHSKFFIFYKMNVPFACVIGSSNFTAGGLHKNIETNAILSDPSYLKEIDKHFSVLWDQSFALQPTDLEKFKGVYDNFLKRKKEAEKEQEEFESKLLNRRTNKARKSKISKEAKMYFTFWRIVDEVKEMVHEIANVEYPGVPVYLTIDHFWHWLKVEWSKESRIIPTRDNRHIIIPQLFREYCYWDKNTDNHTTEMAQASKNLFSVFLSEDNIDSLSEADAKLIYSTMHSGAMLSRRLKAHEKFVTNNGIQKIRTSLRYLLYSNDELDLRIHNLSDRKNKDYHLETLGLSGVQELIGWVSPDKYPMRNDKADDALELLGYSLN